MKTNLRDQRMSKTATFLNTERSSSGEALVTLIRKNQQRLKDEGTNKKQLERQTSRQERRSIPLGGNSGGGGDAVLLESGQVVHLDFYETLDRYQLTPITPSGSNLDEMVASLLERLAKRDSVRAQLYRNWYRTFFAETGMLSNKKAANLADEGGTFICAHCEVFQLVIQKEIDPPISPHRYYIVEDVWNQMSLDQQAYTVIHELLLRELRASGPKRITEEIRYFNALLISDSFKELTREDYQNLLVRFGFLFQTNQWGYLDIFYRDTKARLAAMDFGTYEIGPFEIPVFNSPVGRGGFHLEWGREVWTDCEKQDCFTYVLNRSAELAGSQLGETFEVFKGDGLPILGFVVKHKAGEPTNWSKVLILGGEARGEWASDLRALHALEAAGLSGGRNEGAFKKDFADRMRAEPMESSKAWIIDSAIGGFVGNLAKYQMTLHRAEQSLTMAVCAGGLTTGADFLNFFLGLSDEDPLRPCARSGTLVELTSTGAQFRKIISQNAEVISGQNYLISFTMNSIVITESRHSSNMFGVQTGKTSESIQVLISSLDNQH
ncbi:MAG: hypothetical protein ACK5Y2_00005 [Bdellovibrionales bacterium]